MKVVQLRSFSGRRLQVIDAPVPVPGRGELLLRVRAASLNHRDVEIAEGRYAMPVALPVVPLSDAVGEVVERGADVTEFAVGERVSPVFFPDWQSGPFRGEYFARQLGSSVPGVLGEYIAVPAAAAVRAPAHLADEAAALPIAALTAWAAFTEAALRPGQTVLILGTGGVSLFGLQFAAMFGARAIVAGSDEARLARARTLGASEVIDRRHVPDWGARAFELAAGQGVDLVLEVGGAQSWAQSTAALRVGGRIAVVGYAGGPQLDFDLRGLFIGKRAQLQGHTVGSRQQFDAMNRAIERHRLVPVIDGRFGMDDLDQAYARLASGRAFGKVLVQLPVAPHA